MYVKWQKWYKTIHLFRVRCRCEFLSPNMVPYLRSPLQSTSSGILRKTKKYQRQKTGKGERGRQSQRHQSGVPDGLPVPSFLPRHLGVGFIQGEDSVWRARPRRTSVSRVVKRIGSRFSPSSWNQHYSQSRRTCREPTTRFEVPRGVLSFNIRKHKLVPGSRVPCEGTSSEIVSLGTRLWYLHE